MRGKLLGGRYQVVETLAIGGFGQTYIAEDTHRPGSPKCVIKHLKPASVNSKFLPNARRLFQFEAETLEKLGNHNQIPRLLAYFEENQEFYLAQEFIQGHTLSGELQPGKRWSESQVYQLLQEVLNILVFVHGHGVIHRDIKPDNLIRRQQDNKLVLVDFGSVKQVWTQVVTAQGQTNFTFANSLPATIAIGTPGYMPTEQGRGRPRPNSDIYALGMVAIQGLTGINPTQLIEDSENGEILWQHHTQVSKELALVLTKMVRYHFKNRYQTAAEALQALQLNESNGAKPSSQEIVSSNAPRLITQAKHKSFSYPLVSVPAIGGERSLLTTNNINATQPTVFTSLEEASFSHKTPPASVTLAPEKELPESTTNPTPHHRQYPLRIGAAITAALLSMVVGYTIYWQPRLSTWATLEQIKTLKAAGKYQQCVNQATVPQLQVQAEAQALLHECQLALANQLAATRNFKAAITEASKIPSSDASYLAAQQQIAKWSDSMLEIARNQYQLGNLNEAITIAKAIDQTNPVYQKAQKAIKQWQAQWAKNNSYLKAANNALAQGKWHNAIAQASKVIDTPYWQQKIEPIIQKAEAKIAGSKPPAISKPTPVYKQSTSNTAKITPATTKTVIRNIPRQVTRPATPRRPTAITRPATPRRPTAITRPATPRRTATRRNIRVIRSPRRTIARRIPRATKPILNSANQWLKRTITRRMTYNSTKKIKRSSNKRLIRTTKRKYSR